MLDKEKIDRINELARKKKTEGLTREEQEEQASLRAEYLENFRRNFRQQLDNVRFVEDMTEEELAEYEAQKKRSANYYLFRVLQSLLNRYSINSKEYFT